MDIVVFFLPTVLVAAAYLGSEIRDSFHSRCHS